MTGTPSAPRDDRLAPSDTRATAPLTVTPRSSLTTAVKDAGVARFRPIVLTSLTTFVGLTPLLLEKSVSAQFLIPMAVSLAFGVLFATAVTLYLIPCALLMAEDIRKVLAQFRSWYFRPFQKVERQHEASEVP